MGVALDTIDEKILACLGRDSRTSIRSLAEELHVSRANAYKRVQRLSDQGVIRRFTIQVDPVARGLGTTAYVTLNLRQGDWRNVREALLAISGIVHVALVGGDFDVIILVRAQDNTALRDIVLTRIQSIPGVISTRTFLVFDEDLAGT